MIYASRDESDSLAHYGVLGMKWGVRRYQNEDGSLTKAGKLREEYKLIKKEGKTGYREHIGAGSYAVWPDKKTFNRTVNKQAKNKMKQAKSFKEKMGIRSEAKRYKRKVDMDNMLAKSMYRESAKRVKDRMKSEIKGVPVSQITKSRHKTEKVLATVGSIALSASMIAGYAYLGYKLEG